MDSVTPAAWNSCGLQEYRRMDTFVIGHPSQGKPWDYVRRSSFVETPHVSSTPALKPRIDVSWQAKLSMFITTLLHYLARISKVTGKFVEYILNVFYINGGFIKVCNKILAGEFLVMPVEGSENYWSIVGMLDPRLELMTESSDDQKLQKSEGSSFFEVVPGSKVVADVCIMASKLAYENPAVVNKVVTQIWKMCLVNVFECINKNQENNPTQVFLFMDAPQDAGAIVVTFRGTMPFNAYDWSTDFDFSWYHLPGVGRIHVGFMEALSLVDRHDMESFTRLKKHSYQNVQGKERVTSGLPEAKNEDRKLSLAYDSTKDKLKELVKANKSAKVYITGHSLGGALATVFTAMLFYNKEDSVTERIAGVYTFGQPRVGDIDFADYMDEKLNDPVNRYFRIVYSNDIVPRIPFDDIFFQFKHFGLCFYFDHNYTAKTLLEEPNKNFSIKYFIVTRITAAWELILSFRRSYLHGSQFKEAMASRVLRVAGLFFPGIVDHNPVNYVNSIRLGPRVLHTEVHMQKLLELLRMHGYTKMDISQ
ncbi:uncharacterized protein LOC9654181 isoform X1 [Selaginella moellendorffii]|nr:uncharacterized protein LOC9654181 isoform X1 [Selaginella moellendorffii]|eukprot:XP_024543842.1 uncharacterized protein LOC9654181 isoform X1 [Selaginella moellendorffii]